MSAAIVDMAPSIQQQVDKTQMQVIKREQEPQQSFTNDKHPRQRTWAENFINKNDQKGATGTRSPVKAYTQSHPMKKSNGQDHILTETNLSQFQNQQQYDLATKKRFETLKGKNLDVITEKESLLSNAKVGRVRAGVELIADQDIDV